MIAPDYNNILHVWLREWIFQNCYSNILRIRNAKFDRNVNKYRKAIAIFNDALNKKIDRLSALKKAGLDGVNVPEVPNVDYMFFYQHQGLLKMI